MQTIELIRTNLINSRGLVLLRIEDMRNHALVSPTPRGGCHTLWVLGHLAYIESLLAHTLMRGEVNTLADWEPVFDGTEVSANAADYPPFDDVLARCLEVREETLTLLDTLTTGTCTAATWRTHAGRREWRGCGYEGGRLTGRLPAAPAQAAKRRDASDQHRARHNRFGPETATGPPRCRFS